MKNFKNTLLGKFIVWIMLFSIAFVSCDPNGHIVAEVSMQKHAEEISEFYASAGVNLDCTQIKQYLTKARSYVIANNNQGQPISPTELITYLAQEAVNAGDMSAEEIAPEKLNEVTSLAEYLRFVTNGSTIEPMVDALVGQSTLAAADKDFIMGLENELSLNSNDSPAGTIQVLNQKLSELASDTTISTSHKDAFTTSLNITKSMFCDDGSSSSLTTGNNGQTQVDDQAVSSRCEIIECLTTYEWTLAVIYVVVTVFVFIFAIFTFGLSLLFTTIIAVQVWTLSTVIFCYSIPCPGEPLCPEGQTATCQGNFILDEEGRRCINPNLPSNAFILFGCVVSPRPASGICPPGSTPQGTNCAWDCFFPDPGLVIGSDGQIQFVYTCN